MWAALLVAEVIAAGAVVDVSTKGELRSSALSEPVADGFGAYLHSLGVTPQARAAYEGNGLVVDGAYAPTLSLIYPSADFFLVMHRGNGRASFAPTPRLRVAVDASGTFGDLDAGAAVRDLSNSRVGQVLGGGNLAQLPFADGVMGALVSYRAAPRLTLGAEARLQGTGSPSPGADEQLLLPFQVRPEASGNATWLLSSTDSVTGALLVKGAAIADKFGVVGAGGHYTGVTPSVAYNRSLFDGVVLTTRLGWLTAVLDEGKQQGLLLHGLPVADGRLQSSVNLPGGGAVEGTLVVGVLPFSDPLGGLLEERVSASVQGAYRLNRDLSFTTSATAFGTLYAIGGNAQVVSEVGTSLGGSVGAVYSLTEWVALTTEVIGTNRVLSDRFGQVSELRPEVTLAVSLTSAWNVFQRGTRPAGTDPRPGRAVGTRPVSLPGSARAFAGGVDDKDDDDDKDALRSFRQSGGDDDLIDAGDLIDLRRRGIEPDQRTLERLERAKAKERNQKAKAGGKAKPGDTDGADADADDSKDVKDAKDTKKKDTKKPDPKGKKAPASTSAPKTP